MHKRFLKENNKKNKKDRIPSDWLMSSISVWYKTLFNGSETFRSNKKLEINNNRNRESSRILSMGWELLLRLRSMWKDIWMIMKMIVKKILGLLLMFVIVFCRRWFMWKIFWLWWMTIRIIKKEYWLYMTIMLNDYNFFSQLLVSLFVYR